MAGDGPAVQPGQGPFARQGVAHIQPRLAQQLELLPAVIGQHQPAAAAPVQIQRFLRQGVEAADIATQRHQALDQPGPLGVRNAERRRQSQLLRRQRKGVRAPVVGQHPPLQARVPQRSDGGGRRGEVVGVVDQPHLAPGIGNGVALVVVHQPGNAFEGLEAGQLPRARRQRPQVQRLNRPELDVALQFRRVDGHHVEVGARAGLHVVPQGLVGVDQGQFHPGILLLLEAAHQVRIGITRPGQHAQGATVGRTGRAGGAQADAGQHGAAQVAPTPPFCRRSHLLVTNHGRIRHLFLSRVAHWLRLRPSRPPPAPGPAS